MSRATDTANVFAASHGSQTCWALIPCAGVGTRAGAGAPKQYRMLDGQAVVKHTIDAFLQVARLSGTLVVLAADDELFEGLVPAAERLAHVRCGADSRAGSVRNGLRHLLTAGASVHDWVLVHDAARCLILPDQIEALIAACRDDEVGGLLALPLPDTLKHADAERVATTISRADKWLAQTPQMFRIGALLDALTTAGGAVTDESSAMESVGLSPKLVRGSAQNFKLTYPEDFVLAQAILTARRQTR